MSDLQNKTAIVTGANSGMGMATVEALSDKGAEVIMVCRNEKRLYELSEEMVREPKRHTPAEKRGRDQSS